jgi:hypothetical protein
VSTFVLDSVTTWVAGWDFTCDTNKATLKVDVDDQEATTFCSGGWKERRGGLRNVEANVEGFWQSDDAAVDPVVFNSLGSRNEPVMISPTGGAGDTAYLFLGGKFSYEIFGDVGDMAPFTLDLMGTEGVPGLIRGQVAAVKADVSATGAIGAPVQLGAGSAGKYLYAAVHVFSAGTTVSLKVESDNAQAFSSASNVTGATLGPITSTGGTWMTRVDASSITDDWFRLNVTAVTGTFSMAAALAIA